MTDLLQAAVNLLLAALLIRWARPRPRDYADALRESVAARARVGMLHPVLKERTRLAVASSNEGGKS